MRTRNILFTFLLAILLTACGVDNSTVTPNIEQKEETVNTEQDIQQTEHENEETTETSSTNEILSDMNVHFMDVGQADAALLQYTDGS